VGGAGERNTELHSSSTQRRLLQTPYELVGLGMCSNYFRRERGTEILGHTSVISCKMLCDNNVRAAAFLPFIKTTRDPLQA
jgi:hypothetical protein